MRSASLASGFLILSATAAAAQMPARADTAPPESVIETEFPIQSGELILGATLAVPASASGPIPVAVLIAGSGPTDRNGNSHLGPGMVYRNNALAQLAWRLGEAGIASLRYDKRVLPATKGTVDMAAETFDNFAGDAVAAAKALAKDPRFSFVVLIGHSEGAGLAVRAANAGAPVRGVALLAGMGRPFLEVLREQLTRQLDSAQLAQYDSAMARYLKGEPAGTVHPGLAPLFVPAHRTYIRTSSEYNPGREVAALKVPVLIVQGTTDIQITMADAEALHQAKPGSTLLRLENANHVFKHSTASDAAAQMPTYTDPSTPIVGELPAAVGQWIKGLSRQ